jgi:hypothetical protein
LREYLYFILSKPTPLLLCLICLLHTHHTLQGRRKKQYKGEVRKWPDYMVEPEGMDSAI